MEKFTDECVLYSKSIFSFYSHIPGIYSTAPTPLDFCLRMNFPFFQQQDEMILLIVFAKCQTNAKIIVQNLYASMPKRYRLHLSLKYLFKIKWTWPLIFNGTTCETTTKTCILDLDYMLSQFFFLCSDWPHCPETVRVYTIRVQKPQSIIFAGKRSKRQLHRWLTWFASLVIPQHLQRISMAHLLLLLQCKKAVWNSVYAEAR